MKTLDRYIILQFLLNFVILFLVIMMLYVLVDLIVDLDEFLKAGHDRSLGGGARAFIVATLWRVGDWYGPMIVLIYTYVSGLLVVAAMAFTFAQLGSSGELVAMLTGGISMYRLAAPILVVGGLLNVLTLLNQEFVIPNLAHKLARRKSQVVDDQVRTFAVQYIHDDQGNLFSAESFDPSSTMLNHLTILQRHPGGRAVNRITAPQATWMDDRVGWSLTNGYAVRYSGGESGGQSGGGGEMEPEAIEFVPSSLSPQLLLARRASIYPSLLSLAELRRLTNNPAADQGRYAQIMHSRFSLMVVNVLLLVMALPFFLLREPANMLQQSIKAASVTLCAWGGGLLLLQVDGPPVFSAWLPVVILLPVSAALLQLVKS